MAEQFLNLGKKNDIQIQEFQRVPSKLNSKRCIPRYSIFKLSNVKGKKKILKGAREKQFVTYKATFIRLSRDFSAATSQGRRKLHDIFKLLKGKDKNKKLTNNTLPGKPAKIGEVAETGAILCTVGRNVNW